MNTASKPKQSHTLKLQKYSRATRIYHWLTVLLVVILFPLGLWMGGLDYYHEWYQTAPMLHVGTGLILISVLIARVINRMIGHFPGPLDSHSTIERLLAKAAHILLYLLLVTMAVTGYLLAGIEGQGVSFYDLFALPGVQFEQGSTEDLLENIHELAAYGLVGVALVHALAALKHHFLDRDDTVHRMLR